MEQESFGARLRRLRRQHHETQPDLARALGVSRSAISMYESGEREPKLELLCAIASHYGVELDLLLGQRPAQGDGDLALMADPDIRMIARAGSKMTPEQRSNLLRYARFMFPEAFEGDDG